MEDLSLIHIYCYFVRARTRACVLSTFCTFQSSHSLGCSLLIVARKRLSQGICRVVAVPDLTSWRNLSSLRVLLSSLVDSSFGVWLTTVCSNESQPVNFIIKSLRP